MAELVDVAADETGEPMITLAVLRGCQDAGKAVADILARLKRAVAAAVPPLTLVEATGAAR